MTEVEYKKTMEYVFYDSLEMGELKNLGILKSVSYDGIYFAVIEGKIPYEVSCEIYDSYLGDVRDIETVKRHMYGDKYIESYNVSSKEGLLFFILCLKDYYLKLCNCEPTETFKFYDILGVISASFIDDTSPYISTYQLMVKDEVNSNDYFETLKNDFSHPLRHDLRVLIDKFDEMVNPFMNCKFRSTDVKDKLDKITVSSDNFGVSNSYSFKIIDNETKDSVCYFKPEKGFSYLLSHKEEKFELVFWHYYELGLYGDSGESLGIQYFDSDNYLDVRYNLSTGQFGDVYYLKHDITLKEYEYIISVLEKSIDYASNVTIKNLGFKKYKK